MGLAVVWIELDEVRLVTKIIPHFSLCKLIQALTCIHLVGGGCFDLG